MSAWKRVAAIAAALPMVGFTGVPPWHLSEVVAQNDRAARDQMLRRIHRLSKPIGPHRRLQPMIGEWRGKGEVRAQPEMKFGTARCRLKTRWILGGRFLEQHLRCVDGDAKFEGQGYLGYDRLAGRYVGVWVDSSDTGTASLFGYRTKANMFVFSVVRNNPIARRRQKTIMTITFDGANRYTQTVTTVPRPGNKPAVLSSIRFSR